MSSALFLGASIQSSFMEMYTFQIYILNLYIKIWPNDQASGDGDKEKHSPENQLNCGILNKRIESLRVGRFLRIFYLKGFLIGKHFVV